MTDKDKEITVSEDKWNGTSTLVVEGAENEKEAEFAGRKFFEEEYGHGPSRVLAKEDSHFPSQRRYYVMVADHSSGSLKDSRVYEM